MVEKRVLTEVEVPRHRLEVMFSLAELMCRMLEAQSDRERPEGMTASEALGAIQGTAEGGEILAVVECHARTALEYFAEVFNEQAAGVAEMVPLRPEEVQ